MRVVLYAQDDSAAECLEPLAARGCQVLGVGSSTDSHCSIFARRCVELGFSFVALADEAVSAKVVEGFEPELLVYVPDLGGQYPKGFAGPAAEGGPKKYTVRSGMAMAGAPWPEFAPLWLGWATSRASLVPVGAEDSGASVEVPVTSDDTALSLRMKHTNAAAELLGLLVDGGEAWAAAQAKSTQVPAPVMEQGAMAPAEISLDWDEDTVDRYVRAHLFPPNDPAVLAEPASGETYFIESLVQYREFREKVLGEERVIDTSSGPAGSYAADTHWYSNVGGSIVKMGDSNIHMPSKTADKKRKAVIPGAALGARKKLRMNEPLIGPNAERYCSGALSSGWIGVEGPYVRQFEKQLAEICGCSASCAVQSGTAALYGAMKALGVSDSSHHVLCPAFTCAACADAVVHAGGRPVPIDCDMESYGISLEAVRRALDADKDVVGVVVAPCYGVPARDFHGVMNLCKERGLWVCEDACESYGAMKAGSGEQPKARVGSQATLCVISVRSEKMIGVGEGGAILGNDTTLVARAKWWCSRAPSRGVGLWRVYEHDAVGQNFRLPEMLAAVGCAAAEMLPVMVQRKRAIHNWYEAGFATRPELQSIDLQKAATGDEPVWWLNAALLPEGMSGEKVGMKLMNLFPDIEIRPGFYPLNKMSIFQSKQMQPCPNAEKLYQSLVCLPSSNQLTQPDVERVCDALAEVLRTEFATQ